MSAFIRVLVVSDSHGNRRNLRAVLERHADAAAVFHLGDGAVDMENVAEEFPAVRVSSQTRTRCKAGYFGAFCLARARKASALLRPTETKISQNLLALQSEILKRADFRSAAAKAQEIRYVFPSILTMDERKSAISKRGSGLTAHPTVYGVCGNCDSALRLTPESVETVVGGKRFFAAHGHAFGVKSSPLRFLMEARSRLVDVALFGHTHQPLLHGEEGLILLNPGSVRDGCYAVIDVVNGAIFPHLERL